MFRRLPILLMLTTLGCAAPALAGPPKSGDGEPPTEEAPEAAPDGDAPDEEAPKEEPAKDEPKDEPAKDDAAKDEPPKADEPKEEPKEEPKPPAAPPGVTLSDPEFINGDVPKVASILERTGGDVAQCVADHGGLDGKTGTLRVQFLVRARGRAEGVEVLDRKGVAKAAGRCVQKLLKNKWVGMPSVDPTGVQFSYELKAK